MNSPEIPATILQGHRVASGLNGDARFPGGTIRMQLPFFAKLGLDLSGMYPGTLNVSIAPMRYEVGQARYTFHQVKWHDVEAAEDFSFFDCCIRRASGEIVDGFIYRPHPETKPCHFQPPDVLELLAPEIPGIAYGEIVQLSAPPEQIRFVLE